MRKEKNGKNAAWCSEKELNFRSSPVTKETAMSL